MYGKGINIRDWLHVTDHANALIEVSKTTKSYTRYNIGANQEMTNKYRVLHMDFNGLD